jgi:hypothetical protein
VVEEEKDEEKDADVPSAADDLALPPGPSPPGALPPACRSVSISVAAASLPSSSASSPSLSSLRIPSELKASSRSERASTDHASSSLTVALTPRGSRIAEGVIPPPPTPALVPPDLELAAEPRLRLLPGALDPPLARCDEPADALPDEVALPLLPPTPTAPLRHGELRTEEDEALALDAVAAARFPRTAGWGVQLPPAATRESGPLPSFSPPCELRRAEKGSLRSRRLTAFATSSFGWSETVDDAACRRVSVLKCLTGGDFGFEATSLAPSGAEARSEESIIWLPRSASKDGSRDRRALSSVRRELCATGQKF